MFTDPCELNLHQKLFYKPQVPIIFILLIYIYSYTRYDWAA